MSIDVIAGATAGPFAAACVVLGRAVIGVQLGVAVVAAWIVAPIVVACGVTIAAIVLLTWTRGDLRLGREAIEASPEGL